MNRTRDARLEETRRRREERKRDQQEERARRRTLRKDRTPGAQSVSTLDNLRQGLMIAGLVIASLLTGFTVAFFVTGWIYDITGWHPAGWLAQVISSLLGIFLLGLTMSTVLGILRRSGWEPEAQAYRPILTALQQISRGDFNIKLANTFKEGEPLRNLVKEVNAMALQLGQIEQMRQEFVSNVSHEIQSPLTSIRGFAEALQDETLSPEQRAEYLGIIMSESTRLSRISENLLRLAALEADNPRFEPHLYRLDTQIRDLVLAFEPQWAGKNLDVDVHLDKVAITADADLLSQVWINLLGNAIKFTPSGGKLRLHLFENKTGVIFKIADTGTGISSEDQAHIFERFYKADKSRTSSTGGSGLGLSIAKKIVEMHKGSIDIESATGQGTTFTVSLPAQVEQVAQGQPANNEQSAGGYKLVPPAEN